VIRTSVSIIAGGTRIVRRGRLAEMYPPLVPRRGAVTVEWGRSVASHASGTVGGHSHVHVHRDIDTHGRVYSRSVALSPVEGRGAIGPTTSPAAAPTVVVRLTPVVVGEV